MSSIAHWPICSLSYACIKTGKVDYTCMVLQDDRELSCDQTHHESSLLHEQSSHSDMCELPGETYDYSDEIGVINNETQASRPHKPSLITCLVNQWANRLLGAMHDKSFTAQGAQYAAHRTARDFIWNALAIGSWGMVFPILSIVATQVVGAEQAGMFSMAFVVANLLMVLANFGVRTYQVSDLDERYSFADYQIQRFITCAVMMLCGIFYCCVRDYDDQMFLLCMGVFTYRMVDGLADVYEGRLQQVDKFYLAGISQTLRSVVVLAVFSILLFVTRSLIVAAFGMAAVAVFSLLVLTIPLTYFESPKSHSFSAASITRLFRHCFPLFISLFMYTLIDSMPKFVMEGILSYDNQLYFNALYFPAQFIQLGSQLVYKPMLVRMADAWVDHSKHRRFDVVIVLIMIVIVAIAGLVAFVMAWIGISVMSLLYGIDFEGFRGLVFVMLAGGAVLAGVDFLNQVVTIVRCQKDVTTVYMITFGFSLFIPLLLIEFTGLPGAVLSYLIVMSILFVLLVWAYIKIRIVLMQQARSPHVDARTGKTTRSRQALRRTKRNTQEDTRVQKYIDKGHSKEACDKHGRRGFRGHIACAKETKHIQEERSIKDHSPSSVVDASHRQHKRMFITADNNQDSRPFTSENRKKAYTISDRVHKKVQAQKQHWRFDESVITRRTQRRDGRNNKDTVASNNDKI